MTDEVILSTDWVIQSICILVEHEHTNPNGSKIMIRSLKHLYHVDPKEGPFIMKNEDRVYMTQEEADELYQKEMNKQEKRRASDV